METIDSTISELINEQAKALSMPMSPENIQLAEAVTVMNTLIAGGI
ncbi:hypothetical protein LPY66_17785 [Dehalobacter sp. DCM]|nr:hypothetical protein LPY66_17785 [Dehalobacter sp. DCM]